MLEFAHYLFLGLVGCFAILWALLSMGAVQTRDHDLYTEKEKYIEEMQAKIEKVYSLLSDMPHHNRDKIINHLDNGEINNALDAAQAYHDVYYFFKNYN